MTERLKLQRFCLNWSNKRTTNTTIRWEKDSTITNNNLYTLNLSEKNKVPSRVLAHLQKSGEVDIW